jgi:hypothetical protein
LKARLDDTRSWTFTPGSTNLDKEKATELSPRGHSLEINHGIPAKVRPCRSKMTNILLPNRAQVRTVRINKNNLDAVAKARHQIALLYRRDDRKGPLHSARNNRRFTELQMVLAYNYRGTVLSDDDAGRDDLLIVGWHLLRSGKDSIKRFRSWTETGAPWLREAERLDILKRAGDERDMSADALGKRLGLTDAMRTAFGIGTIGAIDCDKDARSARRAQKSKDRKTAKRRASGATPRDQSLSRRKPWKFFGWSRAKWFRLGKPEPETSAATAIVKDVLVGPDLSQTKAEAERGTGPNAAISKEDKKLLVCSHLCDIAYEKWQGRRVTAPAFSIIRLKRAFSTDELRSSSYAGRAAA